jgi:CRISPR/Cas system CMR subunit Cmr4 (Cas7 group RAMP superfamily)
VTGTDQDVLRRMTGMGGVRALTARWTVSGTLTLVSAAHLGGAVDGPSEMPLLRDLATGLPVLTGTSIAGALRGHLSDFLGGFAVGSETSELAAVQDLFGGVRSSDDGDQSPLVVHDALAQMELPVEIRDGVAIAGATGTAEEHAKYDIELLPAGTTFALAFELDIAAAHDGVGAVGDASAVALEHDLLELLACALAGFEAHEGKAAPISIGARGARGLGACRVDGWRVARHDLNSAAGWIALACGDVDGGHDLHPTAAQAFGTPSGDLARDRRCATVIDLELAFDRSLLVRSPAIAAEAEGGRAPDVVQLRSGGVAVLAGSSLSGALRAHARRIARWVDPATADERVDELFGSAPRWRGGGRGSHEDISPSALRIHESEVRDGAPYRATRIRVDRLTRGVIRGGLFEEEPVRGGRVAVRLELRHADECDPPSLGLLMLVVRDLVEGLVALGGSVAVGRGAIDPERSGAVVRFADGTSIDLSEPGEAGRARLDRLVRALHGHPATTTAGG